MVGGFTGGTSMGEVVVSLVFIFERMCKIMHNTYATAKHPASPILSAGIRQKVSGRLVSFAGGDCFQCVSDVVQNRVLNFSFFIPIARLARVP